MSDPDQLAEIKAQLLDGPLRLGSGQRIEGAPNLDEEDADWLVGEIERLRGEVNHLDRLRWSDHGGELGDEPWQPPYPESQTAPPAPES